MVHFEVRREEKEKKRQLNLFQGRRPIRTQNIEREKEALRIILTLEPSRPEYKIKTCKFSAKQIQINH